MPILLRLEDYSELSAFVDIAPGDMRANASSWTHSTDGTCPHRMPAVGASDHSVRDSGLNVVVPPSVGILHLHHDCGFQRTHSDVKFSKGRRDRWVDTPHTHGLSDKVDSPCTRVASVCRGRVFDRKIVAAPLDLSRYNGWCRTEVKKSSTCNASFP